ncbi:MAG: hypothetical protein R6V58_03925 [Planctomycetota bacterium]
MSLARLDQLCNRFRRKLQGLSVQAGIARVLLLAVVVIGGLFFIDWWAHLPWFWRLLGLLGLVAGLVATVRWTLYLPMKRGWTNEQILSYLDSTARERRGMLLDLYELLHKEEVQELKSPAGQELADKAVRELEPAARQVDVAGSFQKKKAMTWVAGAAAALALFLGVGFGLQAWTGDNYLGIGFRRLFLLSSVRWPHQTTIVLDNLPEEGYRVPQRGNLTVEGHVEGAVPPVILVEYRGEEDTGWREDRFPVDEDGAFEYEFPDVRDRFTFSMEGGDYRTREYDVSISLRPFLEKIVAVYQPVRYARVPGHEEEDGRIKGLEGQAVTLTFTSSMDLASAKFIQRAGNDVIGTPHEWTFGDANRRTFQKQLTLDRSGSYEIKLNDVYGVGQARPEVYEIIVDPDNPPEVEITSPGESLEQTKRARVPVAFTAIDDFNLDKIQVMYQFEGSKPVELPAEITGQIPTGRRERQYQFDWDITRTRDPRDPRLEKPLPEAGTITYFVRVSDGKAGREPVDSARYGIKIVTPAEFHRKLFERASERLLNEARIAERNQVQAWVDAKGWLGEKKKEKEGEDGEEKEEKEEKEEGEEIHPGDPANPLWASMVRKQDAASRGVKAIDRALEYLVRQYQRNGMQKEFMSGRVANISEYVTALSSSRIPKVLSGIEKAKPVTDVDMQPENLAGRRRGQLGELDHSTGFIRDQKMACLILQRLLRRLYDWQDLQTSSIQATHLHDTQEEVMARTREVAPKYIGKSILDLTNEEQEELITLAKRQQAVADAEKHLEGQLDYMIERAEFQRRPSILGPLKSVFKVLRDNRVQDRLKDAARKIENNQSDQIVDHQKGAILWMRAVQGALIGAGRKVDDPGPGSLELTMVVDETRSLDPQRFREIWERRKEAEPENGDGEEPSDSGSGYTEFQPIDHDQFFKNLGEGEEALSQALRFSLERHDDVLARTRFLGGDRNPDTDEAPVTRADLPRFRHLSQGALLERQDVALTSLDVARDKAEGEKAGLVLEFIGLAKDEFGQSKQLLAQKAPNYSTCTQQLQRGTIRLLQTTVEDFLPSKRAVVAMVDENKRTAEPEKEGGKEAEEEAGGPSKRPGYDDKGQPFVLRGKNLDLAHEMMQDVLPAFVYQDHVARQLRRFVEEDPADKLQQTFEAKNRKRAGGLQADVNERIGRICERYEKIEAAELDMKRQTRRGGTVTVNDKAPEKAKEAGLGLVMDLKPDEGTSPDFGIGDTSKKRDPEEEKELVDRLERRSATLARAIGSFRVLFEEVVTIPREVREEDVGPPPMSEREWEEMTDPENIRKRLEAKSDPLLPARLREIMIRQLGQQDGQPFEKRFQRHEKYLPLLRAYYSSFVSPGAEEEEPGTEKEGAAEAGGPEEAPE